MRRSNVPVWKMCLPDLPVLILSFISWASVPSHDQRPSILSDEIQNKGLGEYLNSGLKDIFPFSQNVLGKPGSV